MKNKRLIKTLTIKITINCWPQKNRTHQIEEASLDHKKRGACEVLVEMVKSSALQQCTRDLEGPINLGSDPICAPRPWARKWPNNNNNNKTDKSGLGNNLVVKELFHNTTCMRFKTHPSPCPSSNQKTKIEKQRQKGGREDISVWKLCLIPTLSLISNWTCEIQLYMVEHIT